nr:MAG TPA: homodimerization region of STAR domain protein [Caudoviricetes sp.]
MNIEWGRLLAHSLTSNRHKHNGRPGSPCGFPHCTGILDKNFR